MKERTEWEEIKTSTSMTSKKKRSNINMKMIIKRINNISKHLFNLYKLHKPWHRQWYINEHEERLRSTWLKNTADY